MELMINNMKEQITKLRIEIDGLSQLVKELNSFNNTVIYELPDDKVNFNLQSPSALMRVLEVESTAPNHKYQGLIKTDYGTFRFGSNFPIDIRQYGLDLKSKEVNKCYDSLILAKAWLGKILGELGQETPYKKDGNRHSINDIEKTADVSNSPQETFGNTNEVLNGMNWTTMNHIKKVDWLRQLIDNVLIIFKTQYNLDNYNSDIILLSDMVEVHLSEARFWLGFELQRIKESNDSKDNS